MVQSRQSVIFQISAGADENLFAVNQEKSHGELGSDELKEPI